MTRPRIGILTLHRCINNGSFWQTAALVTGLRERGFDVTVLDHHSSRVNVAEWRCALRPTLPTPVPPADRTPYRAKLAKFGEAIDTLPLSARFGLDRPEDCPDVDIVVVGSDEVWNLAHPWYGGTPLFYGEGLRDRRLVAYAASFGNYDSSNGLGQRWQSDLETFDAISVRDDNSLRIVEDALHRPPAIVLDPCLQFPAAREAFAAAATSSSATASMPSQPFVAVYGHNFSPAFVADITTWAKQRRAHLVSVGYRNDWADEQWLDAGPHEFAAACRTADALVTNFFHGCVFALLDGIPFLCESSPYRMTKITDLLHRLGATEHLLAAPASPDTVAARLEQPPASDIVTRLDHWRKRSDEFLDAALPS